MRYINNRLRHIAYICSIFKCWLEHWFGNFYKKDTRTCRHKYAYTRTHIFSSVHFLIRTHTRALLRTHAHIILVNTFSHPYTQVLARTIAHTRGTGTRDPPLDPLGPLSQTTLNARARV